VTPSPPTIGLGGGTHSATPPATLSYDVQRFQIGTEFPSLGDISKHCYYTDKYAAALLQYNRDYALGDEALKSDPPTLRSGVNVYVPPPSVLQTKYPNLIGQPLSGTNSSAPAGPVSNSQAKPLVPVTSNGGTGAPVPIVLPGDARAGGPLPSAPTPTPQTAAPGGPASPSPGAAAAKLYWVRAGGQHYWQIAQETLGNSERWAEIYHLNPQYPPEPPLPAGAQIKLPPDARIGQ
jgi:hypothetical protein